ncbi:MogA/MoaB family molybdenum cofactor biosynthesis protein [Halobacillus sp. GSS1]|uniref:MogA/MoaB family molybdenum cofactor biosynthesis protein n=1 Tax=Halobacillus sp. GSS1 TaxID=2815919 RepID=UPI001A8E123C|nr:MogA/MoaB family molybdenum cofactor biosynthesis protein [Halobacillus sp. GSS1]MBN9655369.1 MogA/MoaB family molybdenum cofactor biosynthesis protein [Halobacillus sp. GSS1]
MAVEEHKASAGNSISCLVLTVSDTRTEETDKSGKLMIDTLTKEGHSVGEYHIVKDEQSQIHDYVKRGVDDPKIEAVLINGGTGVAKRDVTIEVIEKILDKEMPGFGEIFRMLSYKEDIGSAAILSRAIAGVSGRTAIFSTPGSSGAVKLAMDRLILPELPHIIGELNKDK